MGGGGQDPSSVGGGSKRKKILDAVINVVPAIDLLSCCISFLLITAVWTQVSKLQVQQSAGTYEGPPTPPSVTLNLTMTDHGFTLSSGANAVEIPSLGKKADGAPRYDLARLDAKLKELKTQFPDQSALTLAAEDQVWFEDIVRVIDLCIGAGLPNVSVTAAA
jgi:biopolymer transport protein ExbD